MLPEDYKPYEGGMSYAMRLRMKRLEKERAAKEQDKKARKRRREERKARQ